MRPSLPVRILQKAVRSFQSWRLSRFVDEGPGRIRVETWGVPIKILKGPGARIILKGDLFLRPHLHGREPIVIELHDEATLRIDGEFGVGNGVRIFVRNKGVLKIGGRRKESAAGITADSSIMVERRVEIGADFICAWGVFISDCDWHVISGQPVQADVFVGEHVWLAHGVSVLKGTKIGDHSVLGAHSVVTGKEFAPRSLIAGVPGRIVRSDVSWTRDFEAGL
jgi:acetyltransferase-like isoleucine patch superfamily enzyme